MRWGSARRACCLPSRVLYVPFMESAQIASQASAVSRVPQAGSWGQASMQAARAARGQQVLVQAGRCQCPPAPSLPPAHLKRSSRLGPSRSMTMTLYSPSTPYHRRPGMPAVESVGGGGQPQCFGGGADGQCRES